MPSKGGGGGGIQTPGLNIPTGLYQALSEIEGIGSYGQSLFNPLASMTNWASGIATGGAAGGIGSYGSNALQTGPSITIGSGGDTTPGHYTWTTQFNPQTGQVTFTNQQTGGKFQEAINSPQAEQYLGSEQVSQWTQLYNDRGQSAGSGGEGSLGPQLTAAWDAINQIPGIEAQTNAFEQTVSGQAGQLYGEGQSMLGEGQGMLNKGAQMLRMATTGSGLFPSQNAYVQQGVTAEQNTLQQQLASEGLGASTAVGILKGEAAQQGAATAGQLIQGNISAAEQEQSLGIQEQGAAQNQLNLAQGAQKLALGAQELSLGESSAMAQLSLGFQGQMWTQAMQGYGVLGQLMGTLGSLYGVDVQGYSNILQANVQQNQITAQIAEANAQLQASAASSMGSGLGSIFSMLGSSGGSGGGIFGSGGLGGVFSGIGSLFGSGVGAAGAAGVGAAAGGTASAAGAASDAALTALAAAAAEDARSFAYRSQRQMREWDYILWEAPKRIRRRYARSIRERQAA